MELVNENSLATDFIYTQVFEFPQESYHQSLQAVKEYIQDVLNDPRRLLGGVMFYQAVMYIREVKDRIFLRVNFHLFSIQFWSDHVEAQLQLICNGLLERSNGVISLHSKETSALIDKDERSPVHYSVEPVHQESPAQVKGRTFGQRFFEWWLLVPRAHWALFDLNYQLYTFAITHQGFFIKFVHFFTIPTNAVLSMIFLSQWQPFGNMHFNYGAFNINASILLLLFLAFVYIFTGLIKKFPTWGFTTAIVLTFCWMVSNLWYNQYKVPDSPWYNPTPTWSNPLIWSYIVSFGQAVSHGFATQIPPRISGLDHWESMAVFLNPHKTNSRDWLVRYFHTIVAIVGFPVFCVSVTWMSWPHLIGTEVMYILAGIGYKPAFFDGHFRIVKKSELCGNPTLDRYPTHPDDLLYTERVSERRQTEKLFVEDSCDKLPVIEKQSTFALQGGELP